MSACIPAASSPSKESPTFVKTARGVQQVQRAAYNKFPQQHNMTQQTPNFCLWILPPNAPRRHLMCQQRQLFCETDLREQKGPLHLRHCPPNDTVHLFVMNVIWSVFGLLSVTNLCKLFPVFHCKARKLAFSSPRVHRHNIRFGRYADVGPFYLQQLNEPLWVSQFFH